MWRGIFWCLLLGTLAKTVSAETCEGQLESFEKARVAEAKLLGGFNGRVWRRGDQLYFKLNSGSVVTVTDQDEEVAGVQAQSSSLMAYYPEQQIAILHLQLYEGVGAQLLSLQTGKRYGFYGVPCRSPDGVHIAAFSLDIETSFIPNGVWVYRLENGTPLKDVAIEPQSWGISGLSWTSPTSATLQCMYYPKSGQASEPIKGSGRLFKQDGKWQANCENLSAKD